MRYVKEQKQWMPVLGLLIALIVLVIAVLITIFIVPCFLGRYLFPLAGTVWLLVAVGMYRMNNRWMQVALIVGILSCGLPAYCEELRLENESGLSVYRDCIESEWEEGDVIMADAYFTLMMSIYFPEADYMVYGSMPNCIPFDNCTVFTKWEQLEGVDTVWYLSFSDFRVGNLYDKYQVMESKDISFSYYNIVLEKCVSKE